MLEVDAELDRLAADLGRAPRGAARRARQVVSKGGHNVMTDARRLASGLSHAPLYPQSITYDVDVDASGTISAEIGPDKGRPQGALGNLLEYGSVNNPPHTHLGPSLDREDPNFVREMSRIAEQALG